MAKSTIRIRLHTSKYRGLTSVSLKNRKKHKNLKFEYSSGTTAYGQMRLDNVLMKIEKQPKTFLTK